MSFVRKRDPRVKVHIASQSAAANSAEELERRREAARREMKEQEERARAYKQQSWDSWDDGGARNGTKAHDDVSDEDSEASFGEDVKGQGVDRGEDSDEEESNEDEDEEEEAVFDCVACDKLFQSAAAWDNHERSKKHKQAVKKLQREMQLEEEEFGLDDAAIAHQEDTDKGMEEAIDTLNINSAEENLSKKARQRLKKRMKQEEKMASSTLNSDEDDAKTQEGANPEVDEERQQVASEQESGSADPKTESPKIGDGGRRAARRGAKKGAAAAAERCNVCRQGFDSRSKLFTHIRETGHALATAADGDAGARTKGKKR